MIKLLVATFDNKARRFGFVQTVDHKVDAQRTMKNAMEHEQSPIKKYPADFELHVIGEYNIENGKITAYEEPQHICNATDLLDSPVAETAQI